MVVGALHIHGVMDNLIVQSALETLEQERLMVRMLFRHLCDTIAELYVMSVLTTNLLLIGCAKGCVSEVLVDGSNGIRARLANALESITSQQGITPFQSGGLSQIIPQMK